MAIFIILSAILLLARGQEEEVIIEPYIGEVMESGYTLQ